jgi:c-di-GMP-binding flagellar brake protein YcgR
MRPAGHGGVWGRLEEKMAGHSERRRSVRVGVTSTLAVRCVEVRTPLRLIDVSSGGFSVASAEALPMGQLITAQFASGDGAWASTFRAKVVYSRRQSAVPGRPQPVEYHTGLAFLQIEAPEVQARLDRLIDLATAAITFS